MATLNDLLLEALTRLVTAAQGVYVQLATGATVDVGDRAARDLGKVDGLDDGPSWSSSWGVSNEPATSADMSAAAVNVTDEPTEGQSLVITDLLLGTDTALTFTLTEETSGTVIFGPLYMAANTTQQVTVRGKRKLAADKKLQCQTSAAGNVSVLAGYYSEA